MEFIIAWIFATSFMTLFSYLFYYVFKRESREPYLLNIIILNSFPTIKSFKFNKAVGWILHYLLGVVFLILNVLLCELLGESQAIIWGFPFGIIAGLLGVVGWRIIFKFASYRPEMNFTIFYAQLIVAHIIFCLTASVVYNY